MSDKNKTPVLSPETAKALAVRILDAMATGKRVCVNIARADERSAWTQIHSIAWDPYGSLYGYTHRSNGGMIHVTPVSLCHCRLSIVEVVSNEIETLYDPSKDGDTRYYDKETMEWRPISEKGQDSMASSFLTKSIVPDNFNASAD